MLSLCPFPSVLLARAPFHYFLLRCAGAASPHISHSAASEQSAPKNKRKRPNKTTTNKPTATILLFLIEQDTSDKGTIPTNRREFTLLSSPEMVLDGVTQTQEVETPQTHQELEDPLGIRKSRGGTRLARTDG